MSSRNKGKIPEERIYEAQIRLTATPYVLRSRKRLWPMNEWERSQRQVMYLHVLANRLRHDVHDALLRHQFDPKETYKVPIPCTEESTDVTYLCLHGADVSGVFQFRGDVMCDKENMWYYSLMIAYGSCHLWGAVRSDGNPWHKEKPWPLYGSLKDILKREGFQKLCESYISQSLSMDSRAEEYNAALAEYQKHLRSLQQGGRNKSISPANRNCIEGNVPPEDV